MNKLKSKFWLPMILAISFSLFIVLVVLANTDSKSANVVINGIYTEIREVGIAGDAYDNVHGVCNWLNNNYGSSAASRRVIDPSSCWTVCQANGLEIERINPGRQDTINWYQSLTAYPTYRGTICMSLSGKINRVVNANAHHFIWHYAGIFDNWTSANHTISCSTCNP